METEQAIKISLAYQVADKAIQRLSEVVNDAFFGDLTNEDVDSLNRLYTAAIDAERLLMLADDVIIEMIDPCFDAEDEQAIIDLVCNIEKALNQRPVPVPVHPEISNILNRHLGEK